MLFGIAVNKEQAHQAQSRSSEKKGGTIRASKETIYTSGAGPGLNWKLFADCKQAQVKP